MKLSTLKVDNARRCLGMFSAAFYGYPARKLVVIGVTGTDGKTTTVNLIYNILAACGIQVGMVSTVNAIIGERKIDTGFHVTTPEAPMIQNILRQMVDKGLTHVVLETTSHGLDQDRVEGCEFDIGVITNITHEHLDYHGDYEQYLNAKAKLLRYLAETKPKNGTSFQTAVLNRDDKSFSFLQEILKEPKLENIQVVTYGTEPSSNYHGGKLINSEDGLSFDLSFNNKNYSIQSSLIGEYNAHNIMAAVAMAHHCLKLPMDSIRDGIQSLEGVPGRMEQIDLGQKYSVIVDFAHTPNALKVALKTARKLTDGQVITVFGSAGLRDREKRRMMAAVSVDLADISVLTAEDPRTESLDDILDEMADEANSNGGKENLNYFVVPDRGEAIRKGISHAKKGDLVIICGKGHEQSMCFGTKEYPWDDRTAARAVLSEVLKISGPNMPYLPTQSKKPD